jgi:hypothetical protein
LGFREISAPWQRIQRRESCPKGVVPAAFFTAKIRPNLMLNRNEIWVGLLFGLLLPLLGFVLLYQVFGLLEARGAVSGAGFSDNFRERTLAIVAIALNLLPLRLFRRRRWELAMRGVVIATSVLAFVWLFRYGFKLF